MDNFGIYKLFSALNASKTKQFNEEKSSFNANVLEKILTALPDLLKNFTKQQPTYPQVKPVEEVKKQPKNFNDNPLIKTAISHDEFVKKVMANKNKR